MVDVRTIIELLRGRSPAETARISAYLLAPGLVLVLTISRVLGESFSMHAAPPVALSELRAEVSLNGDITARSGFAVISEPTASEYRIQLGTPTQHIWSSLDENAARTNKERLTLDKGGVTVKSPFLGVDGPVTVVVEGQLGKEIQVPGGVRKVDELLLRSRQSISIVSSVLLACVFALGMSSAKGLPSIDRNKNAAG